MAASGPREPEGRSGDKAPRACTFDCYGTLIDWRTGIEQNLRRILRPRGLHGAQSLYLAYLGAERAVEKRYVPYRDVLSEAAVRAARTLGVALPAAQAREFADSLPRWPAFPDTVEVLGLLRQRGIGRFILSNVDRDQLEATIRVHSLEVDGFVTAEDVRSYKPHPAHWERFFDEHPIERGGVLHVAQSLYHDIVPATALGLRTVWVNRYSDALPGDVRPTFVLPDLRGLPGLFE
jgi:2-haloacid dehalogenase